MTEFDESFDFVVAGSGGGSMCAGLLMRKLGRSVLILEKTAHVGGTTARSGGCLWIPDNPFMAEAGIKDGVEQATAYLDSICDDGSDSPGTSAERRRAYIVEGRRMVEFLIAQGIELERASWWPDYYDEMPGGSKAGRVIYALPFDAGELGEWRTKLQPGFLEMPAKLNDALSIRSFKQSWTAKRMMLKLGLKTAIAKARGQHWVSAGAALQGRMLQAALKAGVAIRTESPVETLIFDGDAVVGVVTVRDGKPWRVGAKLGVLVNAGGFSHNQAMRDRYQPGTRAEWSQVIAGDTGEMIEEMAAHGAALGQMEEMVGYQTMIPPGKEADMIKPSMQNMTAAPHAILVDQSGVRYQNEGGSYMAYCKAMLERNRTVPAVPSWAIFDAQYMAKYGMGQALVGGWKAKQWLADGYMKQADTVAGLAAAIGADPATLAATLDRFNGFVDKGHDDDFQRGVRAYDNFLGDPHHDVHKTLGTIEQAPFYALPVLPGDVGTYGGVVTDTKARVLKADGSVIPGLYATGISTASVFGRYYVGAGASVGPSFTFGYVAAKHAAGADNLAA